MPQSYDTSIPTQINSAYHASVGANYSASDGLYQSTNQNDNTDVKDNNDSQ